MTGQLIGRFLRSEMSIYKVHNWAITAEVERMHVLYMFALRCPALKKGCCIDRQLIGRFLSEMSIYKAHNWAKTAEVERMHVLYIFALRCPALKKGCCIDR